MGMGRHMYGEESEALSLCLKYSCSEGHCTFARKSFPGLVKQKDVASKYMVGESKQTNKNTLGQELPSSKVETEHRGTWRLPPPCTQSKATCFSALHSRCKDAKS